MRNKPTIGQELIMYSRHTHQYKTVTVSNESHMSNFRTCRELQIQPAYSSVNSLHPYDLDFAYVEWGQPLKSYDRGKSWQRQKLGYQKCFLVVSLSGDTCYICRNWEAATELQQHLMEREDAQH